MSRAGKATKMQRPVESTAAVAICRLRESSTWPSFLQRIDKTADVEDVGGDGVAGGVVGAHGGGGVGDADPFDGARIVGGDPLVL